MVLFMESAVAEQKVARVAVKPCSAGIGTQGEKHEKFFYGNTNSNHYI